MSTWLDEFDGPTWRYRSTLRPVTQLPMDRLGVLLDKNNIGPDVRTFTTSRELTPFEVSQFDLELLEEPS